MKNILLIIFIIILAFIAIVLYKGAQFLPRPFDVNDVKKEIVDKEKDVEIIDNQKQVFGCEPEQRGVDACIAIFKPVCAEINVQCVTTPCPPIKETFSNSCEACKNSLVDQYTEGECVIQ